MSTRNLTYLTCLIKAVFILALCGILAAGVCAEGRHGSRGDRRDDRRDSAQQESKARDDRDRRSDSSRDSSAQRSSDSGSREQARSDRDDSRSRSRSDDHKSSPDSTRSDYRHDQRPDTNTPRSGDSWNRRGDDWRNSSRTDSRPSGSNWSNRDWNKPQVYTPDRSRGRDDNWSSYRRPSSYRAPTHYYPSHSKPYRYGYWVFDHRRPDECRRSVYFHYGYFPYLQVTRIHILPYIIIGYRGPRTVLGSDYYLSRETSDLDRALDDIRDAWIMGRYDLIERHVDSYDSIAVLLDGSYDYSLDAEDYADMTSDALDEISTVSFTWESIRERTNGDYTAFGRHIFRDSRGDLQTVYVSYTLRRMGSDYTITEVGSSNYSLM